ncbi:MAG: molybdopterin-guanine dinucleotide biosynthesis protein MobB [Acidobacteria bacterium]|nr:molybdopterin-guanine dinucleotide biosynthesis protein MobB [Acidobacteriota bacterium]
MTAAVRALPDGPPRILGLVGASGSGKTELACRLIEKLAAGGVRVAFVKHTHHPLNDDRHRGDTARALDAGATTAWLISGDEAVKFVATAETGHRTAKPDPFEIDADVVIVEGARDDDRWPRLRVETMKADDRAGEVDGVVDARASQSRLSRLSSDDLESILRFFEVRS